MSYAPVPLFDLGNVIVKVDFGPFVAWLAEQSETKDSAKAEAFLRSPLFYEFEFGNLGREDFYGQARALYGFRASQREFEERFCDIFPGAVEGMVELLSELSGGQPVYALSNTNEVHLSWIEERHPQMLRPFRKIFASHELRQRKPDPAIYRNVATQLGVPPGKIVFFDDLHSNVEGARSAGLEAHLFTDTEKARSILAELKRI